MCLFIQFTGFYFPSPVDRMVSELSTMTHPSWVALHDHQVTHRFTELRVPLHHEKAMIQEGEKNNNNTDFKHLPTDTAARSQLRNQYFTPRNVSPVMSSVTS